MPSNYVEIFRIRGTSYRPIDWGLLKKDDVLVLKGDGYGKATGETHDDPYAIAIYHEQAGFLGYVPRRIAMQLVTPRKDGALLAMAITDLPVGPEGHPGIQVTLWVTYPKEAPR